MSNRRNRASLTTTLGPDRSESKQAFAGKASRAYSAQAARPDADRGQARFGYVLRLLIREDDSAPEVAESYLNRLLTDYQRIHGSDRVEDRDGRYLKTEIVHFLHIWSNELDGIGDAELGGSRNESKHMKSRLRQRLPASYHRGLVFLLRFLQVSAGCKTPVGHRVQVILANAAHALANRSVEEITMQAAPQTAFEVLTRKQFSGKWAPVHYYNFLKSIYQRMQDPSLSPAARLDARRLLAIELEAYLRRDSTNDVGETAVTPAFVEQLRAPDYVETGDTTLLALEGLLIQSIGWRQRDIERGRYKWSDPTYQTSAETVAIPDRFDDTREPALGLTYQYGADADKAALIATQESDPLNYHFAPVPKSSDGDTCRLLTRDPALPHRLKFFGARFTPASKRVLGTKIQSLADNASVTVNAGYLARVFYAAMSETADALFALPTRAERADAAIEEALTRRIQSLSQEDQQAFHELANGLLAQLGSLDYYRRNVYVNIWDARHIARIIASGDDQRYETITRQSYEVEQRFDPYERRPIDPGQNALPNILATRTLSLTDQWGEVTERLLVLDRALLEQLRAELVEHGWDTESLKDCRLKVRFRYQTYIVPDQLQVHGGLMNLAGDGYVSTHDNWAEEWYEMSAAGLLEPGSELPDYRLSMTTNTNDPTAWSLEITTMVVSPGERNAYTTPGYDDYGIR